MEAESTMNLGFIGLGAMGEPMAESLLAAGHGLAVFNRSPARAERLRQRGARVASSPADAARGAEAVFTMLADDAAVESVVFGLDGLRSGLARDSVHVSSSTISVALSERLEAEHAAAGQAYLAATVFGRPEAAAARQLWVVAAGAPRQIERCRPLLGAFSRGMSVVGERPPAANAVKLAGNFLIGSMIEALGEAFALIDRSGVTREDFLAVFQSVLARSTIFEGYAARIAEGADGPAGFKLRLALKDLRLVLAAADAREVPMPLASLVHDAMLSGVASGKGDLDWSALARVAAERAGEVHRN
jgi:3-hydroxyisobutyrate dehydrogenase-like beta-hydroxyacid dehydrogenase